MRFNYQTPEAEPDGTAPRSRTSPVQKQDKVRESTSLGRTLAARLRTETVSQGAIRTCCE